LSQPVASIALSEPMNVRKRAGGRNGYQVEPFTRLQRQAIDWLDLMQRRHIVHALLEVDVTGVRRAIRAYRRALDRPLSLTTFVVACVARAIGDDPHMHAYTARVASSCSSTTWM
jgi:hypothetical protein